MRLISHRGNLSGPNSCVENHPDSIAKALRLGYDCEIDVWKIDNKFWLGHDEPLYEFDSIDFFDAESKAKLWIHCKNFEALNHLRKPIDHIDFFFHNKDDYTLTSSGLIWTYPGKQTGSNSILVHNECIPVDYSNIYGLCTDYVEWHEEQMHIMKAESKQLIF